MQSILRKGRSLNRQNDWRSPACVAREKLVIFTRKSDFSNKNDDIKKINKKKICMVDEINNVHLEKRVIFIS